MSTFIIAAAIICIILMVVTLCLVVKRINEFIDTYKETNIILQESLGKISHCVKEAHGETSETIETRLRENHISLVEFITTLTDHVVKMAEITGEIKTMIEERKSVPVKLTVLQTSPAKKLSDVSRIVNNTEMNKKIEDAKKSLKQSKGDLMKEIKETKAKANEKLDRDRYKEVMRLRKTMTLQEIAKHLGYKSKSTVQHIIKKGKANNW